MTIADNDIAGRIERLLAAMSAAWRNGDFAFLQELWRLTPDPLYLAEEAPDFARSAAALDDYWARTAAGLADVRGDYRLLSVSALLPPLYAATFVNEWAAREKPGEEMVAGTCRGMMIVDASGETLVPRVYVEAPMAPLLYMRELYKLVARTRGLD